MKKIIRLFLVLLLITMFFSFASCLKDPEINSDSTYEYIPSGAVDYTVAITETTENATDTSVDNISGGKYTVNDEWIDNFSVTYVYKTPQIVTEIECRERRFENSFIVEELQRSKSIQYYKSNGADIDCYIIIEGNEEHAHSVLKDQEFNPQSFFMEKFTLGKDIQLEKNAVYMNDESVAGRLCCKYLLGEYKDGKRIRDIYIWIDVQYGFIAKLIVENEAGLVVESREVKEFSAGNMTEKDVSIDLSEYKFKETE